MNLKKLFEKIGPGPIVTAAFIGPGTVTVCTLAGISSGYSLLWALGLSVIATVFLQEISGRLGLLARQDLSQLIRSQSGPILVRVGMMVLILLAIGLGNAAYEGGNITGANLGLGIFWEAPAWKFGPWEIRSGNLGFGLLAFVLLWSGDFKWIERVLVGLVFLMSAAFLLSALLIKPDLEKVFSGFIPSLSSSDLPTALALIGTTVVPYNLFLYASLVKRKWSSDADLNWMRKDIVLSVVLGGLVSMGILIVGAANPSTGLENAQDIARGLEGVFGIGGRYLMGFGLLAAGMTSALTAPLAGALVITGLMGWDQQIQSTPMRLCIGLILALGILFSSLGIRPVHLITLAQLANGALLPVISAWLIWAGTKRAYLSQNINRPLWSILGLVIWLVTLALGIKSMGTVFEWF